MKTTTLAIAMMVLVTPALAAGNGAGAGGAGHQRAINTGLVHGEKGPPGSPNNPRQSPRPPDAGKPSSGEGSAPR